MRRVNFITPDKFPYTTLSGEHYDTGEYEKPLDQALELVDYQQLRQEQAELRKQGRYLGIGLASYVEICGFGPWESATVRVEPGGEVTIFTGISPHGQGQETTFAQIAADYIGADFDKVIVHHGDTGNTPHGNGTGGSRGLAVGGAALVLSLNKIADKANAHRRASAGGGRRGHRAGRRQVPGQGRADQRRLTLAEIAGAAYGGGLPEEIDAGLESTDFFKPADETFPFGTHVAVVEVFPETGEVKLLRYVSVDDCGNIISPMLVTGQVHGGLAQGIGLALWEELHYDDNGELLTGTLNDYALPKADGFPTFETHHTTTTTPINPLGAKGIGEAATIGATPTAANAVIDALSAFGITHLDIPFTPEKVWKAIQEAQQGQAHAADGGGRCARGGAACASGGCRSLRSLGGAQEERTTGSSRLLDLPTMTRLSPSHPSRSRAIFSAPTKVGRLVLARVTKGMIAASATRTPSSPCTRPEASTTADGSLAGPMRQVPAG